MGSVTRLLLAVGVLSAVMPLAGPPSLAQPAPAADAARQTRVLVVYATRRDAEIVTIGERTLPRILEEQLGNVDYYSEYVDRARFPEPSYRSAFQGFLRAKYADVRFDAIITVQEAALELVRSARHDLFPGVPIVFFTTTPVTGSLTNATGLFAALNLTGTLDLIAVLQPDIRHLHVVTGAAPSDREYERVAREQLARYADRFTLTYLSGLPTSELMSRLAALPPNSAVYYLLANRDGAGAFVHPLEFIDPLTATASAPVYCWVDSAMGRGIVGGSLKNLQAEIEALGRLAVRVITEQTAEGIPLSSPDLNEIQVDWRQLQRWGIRESRVPVGARVLFKEPSAWDRYRGYILATAGVLVAQTLLIGGLLAQRRRRRLAEAQVRGGQEALRNSYDRIRDLGARLLTAQDTERARIARDLHDDISQQIALLSIDLELLSGAVPPEQEPLATEALNRASDVARSVHELSHSLHPAKLRLVGLVAALQALHRELSRSGQIIAFTHAEVPASLPPEITLPLFRIAQEILRNAAKYSGAHRIDVRLQGVEGALVLSVEDDGVGFDAGQAWGKGLGLISIAERVEGIGGTLDIRTAPGEGASFTVRVPITSAREEQATARAG